MDGMRFRELVMAHENLQWLGVKEEPSPQDSDVYVKNRANEATFALSIGAILGNEWADLEAVMTLKRPINILHHITRIVGYFSRVENWNKSKVSELRDRAKGSYGLPNEASPSNLRVPPHRPVESLGDRPAVAALA